MRDWLTNRRCFRMQLLTSKLTYVKGKFTVEPSYNIAKVSNCAVEVQSNV